MREAIHGPSARMVEAGLADHVHVQEEGDGRAPLIPSIELARFEIRLKTSGP